MYNLPTARPASQLGTYVGLALFVLGLAVSILVWADQYEKSKSDPRIRPWPILAAMLLGSTILSLIAGASLNRFLFCAKNPEICAAAEALSMTRQAVFGPSQRVPII